MSAVMNRCPVCERPTHGWLSLPAAGRGGSVGLPVEPSGDVLVILRCEGCGTGVAHGAEVDLEAELAAISTLADDGSLEIRAPNRRSLQAAIGGEGWAALDRPPRSLQLTPEGLELLLERCQAEPRAIRQPKLGRNTLWMLETLINAFTFRPNFLRRARAGELRPATAKERLMNAVDWGITLLAAAPLSIVALLLETPAALAGRGGELRARATREVRA